MGLFKFRGLAVAVFALVAVCTVQAALVDLIATSVYEDISGCTTTGTPVQVTAIPVESGACTPVTACALTSDLLYQAVGCSSTDGSANGDFLTTFLTNLFGSSPYVVVEQYAAGESCATTALSSIKTYLADGKCHKTSGSASYIATRAADGSAIIKPYFTIDCSGASVPIMVTASQAAGNSCGRATGIADMKIYGSGITSSTGSATLYLSSTMFYDTNENACVSPPAVPTQVSSTVLSTDTICTATTDCTGSEAPFIGSSCSSTATYKTDMAVAFGSNPYVVVETYGAGKSCESTELISIKTYLADGKCHKTGAAASYTATSAMDGSVDIDMYTDSTCSSAGWTLSGTAAQVVGNSCVGGSTGIQDKKISIHGVTSSSSIATSPLFLSSSVTNDTSLGDCPLPALPMKLVTSLLTGDNCVSSTSCRRSEKTYESTACTTPLANRQHAVTAFGSNPYVIVEKFPYGKYCDESMLLSTAAYLADAKCHKSSPTTSFRASRREDGAATVMLYANSTRCIGTPTIFTVAADQAADNWCNGGTIDDPATKMYGDGVSPLYLTSTITYDTHMDKLMSSMLPTKISTTVLSVDTCKTPTAYSSLGNFRTACSSTSTFKSDVAATLGSNPYVIMEKYVVGKNCAAAQLLGITTYLADGQCHQTGAMKSYRAMRAANGSATISAYTDSFCSSGAWKVLDSSAAQTTDNSCTPGTDGIFDVKIYSNGAALTPGSTTLYLLLTMNYDMSTFGCRSPAIPTQVMTSVVPLNTCVETTACAGTTSPYQSIACSSTSAYKSDMALAFGSNPYVIVEKYVAGMSCDPKQLTTITTYLADGKCHATGSMSSYKATRATDGSATINAYWDMTCSTTGWTLTVSASQATGNSCATDAMGIQDLKIYGYGETPALDSETTSFILESTALFATDANFCILTEGSAPIQLKARIVDVCMPSSSCIVLSDLYSGTACSTSTTYKADIANAFGMNPYLMVEKYTAGANCSATKLAELTVYFADGNCHKTSAASSYEATRAADGSAVVETYATADCVGTSSMAFEVTASQASGNSCVMGHTGITDTRVYGSGATPVNLKLLMSYDSNMGSCTPPVVPMQVVASVVTGVCTATSACTGAATPFTGIACSSVSTYRSDMANTFGTSPFITVERYNTGKSCSGTELAGITTYLTDDTCHTMGTTSSYKATRLADGSTTIMTFTDSKICATTGTKLYVSASQAMGNSCANDANGILDTKVYASG